MRSNCCARQAGIGRRRSAPRGRARRARTGRRRPCPRRAGPARRARRCGAARRPGRRPRPPRCAARHSSTSKRLDGTSKAREGSSRRWLARPTRWISRLAPFGAPTLMTRSTSPQSMPRSSVEVHTTALSVPAAMAASTLRRRAASSEPWCSAIGRLSSLMRHSSWNISSAWLRVLTNTSDELVRLDGGEDLGDGIAGGVAGPGQRLLGLQDADLGPRAALGDDQVGEARWCRRPAAAPGRRAARSAAPPWRTGRCAGGRAPASAAWRGRAPAGRRAWSAPARAARRG